MKQKVDSSNQWQWKLRSARQIFIICLAADENLKWLLLTEHQWHPKIVSAQENRDFTSTYLWTHLYWHIALFVRQFLKLDIFVVLIGGRGLFWEHLKSTNHRVSVFSYDNNKTFAIMWGRSTTHRDVEVTARCKLQPWKLCMKWTEVAFMHNKNCDLNTYEFRFTPHLVRLWTTCKKHNRIF